MYVLITFRQKILIQINTDDNLTIKELRNHIANVTGIPPKSQTLTCNGVLLDGNYALKDYKLPSTVRICLDLPLEYSRKYRIYVKTPFRNRPLKVNVWIGGTLADLKKVISLHEKVPLDQEIIVYDSCVLEEENDSQTLIALGIKKDAEVEVILKRNKSDLPGVRNGKGLRREQPIYPKISRFSTKESDSEVFVGPYREKKTY
ncbi:hypothetical protein Aperf_G00000042582 [Anoplocephala perfoliata]